MPDAYFGAAQIGASAYFGPAAPMVAALGADNVAAGAMTMWQGKQRPTLLFQSARGVGFSESAAGWVEFGVNLGFGAPNIGKIASNFALAGTTRIFDTTGASSMWLYHSIRSGGIIRQIPPSKIKFSQSSVNNTQKLVESMQKFGWKWTEAPIDIVRMKDGSLITIDNTRLLAAHETGINVRAIIREEDQLLRSKLLMERFWTPKGGYPKTWGDAVTQRINKQNSAFRDLHCNGSHIICLGVK